MVMYTEEHVLLTLTVVTEIYFYSAYIKYVGNLLRNVANILPPTRRRIPEDCKLHQQCCKTSFYGIYNAYELRKTRELMK